MIELLRDKEQGTEVKDKQEFRKLLLNTLVSRIDTMALQFDNKDKTELYEALSDAHELYNVFVTQCLQATTELATKARYDKAGNIAKERAETLGGYFNGVVSND